MIVTEQLFELEDQAEKLVETLLTSNTFKTYKKNRRNMYASPEVIKKQADFLSAKEDFEKIEAYGNHAPDFRKKQRAVRQAKRALDMTEEVAEFRFSETAVQSVLDAISLNIAKNISEEIKVDVGNPFFEKGNHGCGGNCHAS
ncbi:YlbF family regulator [Enterococcus rivorum]|uniref:Transcriptional regulator n=1 Tax=Enterococcus rivorum TaxID=762845 RepID=A0A1E5KXL5_9ENTE|nr:YlbF family regulator [Enterococcus rivorum]MBP2099787.1 cell fate (sporulation/competence/biofilm development) regulator YlbF (YheA/YmcA/DUF963 family) [Enterococcus rivorum]OEH82631.1 transcriptional regulator [Enterococcus rivorum]